MRVSLSNDSDPTPVEGCDIGLTKPKLQTLCSPIAQSDATAMSRIIKAEKCPMSTRTC